MNLSYPLALIRAALKSSSARPGPFFAQVALMALNNLVFFSIWWVLFARYGTIRGFALSDMLALFGAGAAGFGLAVVVCGGMLELARTISDGELDPLLTQPSSVLVRALCGQSRASGWGDLASGLVLLACSGYGRTGSGLLAIALIAVGYAASATVLHSTAFWLGRSEAFARTLFEFVITFTLYPPSLFEGGLRIVLYTLLPAGLIAYLPLAWLRAPSFSSLALALLGTATYAWFASALFARGLRRYQSGSGFVTLV